MSQRRKLVAILSADVVGYSRLMSDDEQATLSTLEASREIFRRHIAAHEGRVVDSAGDALLAEFPSAIEAVGSAIEIQRELAVRNASSPEDRAMRFRIGINLGDVTERDGALYGDGVNIAARLESVAEGGGVCVSGMVYDQVEGKLAVAFRFAGEQQLKNIAKPVRVYHALLDVARSQAGKAAPTRSKRVATAIGVVLLVAGAAAILFATRSDFAPGKPTGASREDPVLAMPHGPSIAVFPFSNISGDPAQDFFSDGLTEQITAALSRFRGLYVIGRNSTIQYKSRALDVHAIGRELGARYALEGSVRRSAKTLRVTVQLSETTRGAQLWAETYDRELTGADILALQDSITSSVVANIAGPHGEISRVGLDGKTAKPPGSLDSYDCVLRAYVWNRVLSKEGHGPLRDCLEAAVARDPEYGEAWAWLALSYLFEYEAGYNPRPKSYNALDRALEAGQRAVQLDPNNAIVHANLSYVHFLRREIDASLGSAERALVLNPNDPTVLCQAGQKMVYSGRNQERGIALTKKAMALGPHYPTWCHYHLSYFYYQKGDYEQALNEALKIDMPDMFWTQAFLAMDYGQLGRPQEARAAVDRLLKLYADFPRQARREFRNYMPDVAVERFIDGLRKAGLDIPPENK